MNKNLVNLLPGSVMCKS